MTANSMPLPPTAAIAVDPDVQRLDGCEGATVLLGGSPLRMLRLDTRAGAVFDQLAAGTPLGSVTGAGARAVERLARRLLDSGIAHPVWPATGGPDASSVTVVVPVRDRAAELGRLLPTLGLPPAQVIVVDDGSTDASAQVAADFGARVLRNTTAHGPGAARNKGLAEVTTPLVVFIDSDCTVDAGWLGPLLAHLQDPVVALVAPRVCSPTGAGALKRYLTVRSPLDLGGRGAAVRARSRVAYVPAAALLARTDVLRSLGGFDPALRVGEDVDLVWRIAAGGHNVRYEPAAHVTHHDPARLSAVLGRNRSYGTSAAALSARHPGSVPPLAVSAWSAAAWAAIATQTPAGLLGGVCIAAVSTAMLPRKLAMVAYPVPTAIRLAGRGHLGAGRLIASAATRTWWPLALPLALVSRRARRVVVATVVGPAVLEWREHRRAGRNPPNLGAYAVLRTLDDAAYCAGVWQGAWHARSGRVLLPDLTSWPGRSRPSKMQP